MKVIEDRKQRIVISEIRLKKSAEDVAKETIRRRDEANKAKAAVLQQRRLELEEKQQMVDSVL